jgi:hypothetical protein
MKKTLLAVAGTLTLASAIAGQAQAQPYGPPSSPGYAHAPGYDHPGGYEQPGGWDIDHRIHWMEDRIMRGRADHALDRHEFRRVQFELNRIGHDFHGAQERFGGRLPDGVRADFEGRLDRLNDQIHWLQQNDVRRPW